MLNQFKQEKLNSKWYARHKWLLAILIGAISGFLYFKIAMLPISRAHDCSWFEPVSTEYFHYIAYLLVIWRIRKHKDAVMLYVLVAEGVIHFGQFLLHVGFFL